MMRVTLYTTHCPKCRVIEKKLAQAGVEYIEVSDVQEMTKLGFRSAPMLDVDGKIMDFMDANRWLKNL